MLTVNVENDFQTDLLREAIGHLERAVEGDPGNHRYRRTLGEALLAARRFDAGLAHLLMAHHAHPEPRTAYLIAFAYWRLGKPDQAEPFLAQAGADDPIGFARLDVLRGRILYDRKNYAEAANLFARALITRPDAPDPSWNLARALVAHATGLGEDTSGIYRRVLQILNAYKPKPEQTDEWHLLLGRTFLALQYPMESLKHLEASRAPAGGEKALLLGVCLLLRGAADTAVPWLKMAAASGEMRRRTESYLSEIAGAPADVLQAMGAPDAGSASRTFLDREVLARIFGTDAPEIARIQEAATLWLHDPRTRADFEPRGGRLFAGNLRDASLETYLSPSPFPSPSPTTPAVQSYRNSSTERLPGRAATEADHPLIAPERPHVAATPPAELTPRTHIDVGRAATTSSERETSSLKIRPVDTGLERLPTAAVPIMPGAPGEPRLAAGDREADASITPTDVRPFLRGDLEPEPDA